MSTSTSTGLALAAILATVLVGCTVQQSPAASSSGGNADAGVVPPGDGGAASGESSPALTCMQILQCISDCPDADAACPDACGEKGTADGKAKIIAFAQCVDTEKCTDATCVQEKCADSLKACIDSSAPKQDGAALNGTAPPGSVPGDLVGSWAIASYGATERLIFNADGTGSWMTALTTSSSGGCLSFSRTTRSGSVVIGEKTITIYATSILSQVQQCKPPTEDSTEPPTTYEIAWERKDADTISIVDAKCAAQYAGSPSSIGLYCTNRLKRE